jgi:hypothetical protein
MSHLKISNTTKPSPPSRDPESRPSGWNPLTPSQDVSFEEETELSPDTQISHNQPFETLAFNKRINQDLFMESSHFKYTLYEHDEIKVKSVVLYKPSSRLNNGLGDENGDLRGQ